MPLLIHFIINIKVSHDYPNIKYNKNNNFPTTQHILISDRDNIKTLNSRYDSQGSNIKQRVIGSGG